MTKLEFKGKRSENKEQHLISVSLERVLHQRYNDN